MVHDNAITEYLDNPAMPVANCALVLADSDPLPP